MPENPERFVRELRSARRCCFRRHDCEALSMAWAISLIYQPCSSTRAVRFIRHYEACVGNR